MLKTLLQRQCRETKNVLLSFVYTSYDSAFVLQKNSEIACWYFHIKEKCFIHVLSYAAYYHHYLAIFSFCLKQLPKLRTLRKIFAVIQPKMCAAYDRIGILFHK